MMRKQKQHMLWFKAGRFSSLSSTCSGLRKPFASLSSKCSGFRRPFASLSSKYWYNTPHHLTCSQGSMIARAARHKHNAPAAPDCVARLYKTAQFDARLPTTGLWDRLYAYICMQHTWHRQCLAYVWSIYM
jgi:hypothetical protein